MNTKLCTKCSTEKTLDQFYVLRQGKKGPIYRSDCKTCKAAHAKQWFADNAERTKQTKRAHGLKANYGITVEEYDRMFQSQNGKCAICGQTDNKALAVDHCHTSGNIRGLLCNNCNRAIGLLQDNAVLLRTAASYLERSDEYGWEA